MEKISVKTPHGTLVAYVTGDTDYPAIAVDLIPEGTEKEAISLSLTEYIPGGESIADYGIGKSESERQKAEVPAERIGYRNDGKIITAGFVTRAWPDETHDMDCHTRTFHVGYPIPDRAKLTVIAQKYLKGIDNADADDVVELFNSIKALATGEDGQTTLAEALEKLGCKKPFLDSYKSYFRGPDDEVWTDFSSEGTETYGKLTEFIYLVAPLLNVDATEAEHIVETLDEIADVNSLPCWDNYSLEDNGFEYGNISEYSQITEAIHNYEHYYEVAIIGKKIDKNMEEEYCVRVYANSDSGIRVNLGSIKLENIQLFSRLSGFVSPFMATEVTGLRDYPALDCNKKIVCAEPDAVVNALLDAPYGVYLVIVQR